MIDNILTPLISWAWFLLGITSVLYFLYATLRYDMLIALNRLFYRVLLVGLVVIVGLNAVNTSFVFINPHQVGVVISALAEKGVREKPMAAGRHWIFPFFEKVVVYPIGLQTYTMSGKSLEGAKVGDDSITAQTKDGNTVNIDCSIVFRLDPNRATELHIMWQDRYVDEFIRPMLRSILRREISKYTINNVEERAKLEKTLRDVLERLITKKGNGLVYEMFFLRNIAFSPEYISAIEKKHAAQLEAEMEANAITLKAIAEAEAEATAKAIKAECTPKEETTTQLPKCQCQCQ